MAVVLVGWATAWCMGVNMFFVVPDAMGTIGAKIFWAPVQSCLVARPVTPKFVSGLWGHQWDSAKAAHRWVANI